MAKTTKDKLADLMKKEAELKAQIQAIKARESEEERKRDTRRKILLGAMTQEMMNEGPEAKQRIMARLDKYLTRPDDRALFDLPATKSQP